MKKAIPFAFNIVYFGGFAFMAPFLVLYYQQLGFSGAQISLLAGLPPLVTLFFAPLWTNLADASRRHRLIMSMGLIVVFAVLVVFPFLKTFALVMFLVLTLNIFVAPITSFADAATMSMLGDEKEIYGRIRLGGSIGWGLAAPLAGALIKAYGLNMAFWGCAVLLMLGLVISQGLSFGGHEQITHTETQSRGVRELLSDHRWLLFLGLAFFGGVASASVVVYFPPYMNELGANEFMIGLALFVASLSELPVFFFGDLLVKRFGPYRLLILGLVVTGIRSLFFAASGAPIFAILTQLLHGFTFPVVWMAGVSYADENAPPGLKSTAQGLFGAMIFGFGSAVGGFIGGFLLESIGGRALFLVYGVVVLIGVAVISFIENRITVQHAEV